MRPGETVRDVAGLWDVALPARAGRMAGVSMAGFRSRADRFVDMQVVPYPALTLFIDFGDGRLVDDAGSQWANGGVVGLVPGGVRGRGRSIDCLQVRLSPVVAYAAFGAGLDLSGAMVSLDALWGREAGRTQERLREAGSWEDRFAVAREVLERRSACRAVDPEVAFVWGQMVRCRGRVRVERLADEAGWSRKRLWSRFRDQVGLTPKRAAQLVRFDHAVHRLAEGQASALVAAEGGYADQSHLHREVRSFAGLTPTAAAAAQWLDVDDVAWARSRAGRGRAG
ncbi:helix-turn-helix domain-containing protein [Streptomyces sp. YIM 130001]|uniref:helix-turn-helix domain-containing protein n=1 Tax=Streptomyces sp. YIM 130001 TaxID=2259644 RepID=UPI000E65435A|nr:helix-turn-helix domain-containing protein [Streptomyces sp. YIM 130001]